MRRLQLLALSLWMIVLGANATNSWHLLVDNDKLIPLVQVTALAYTPYESLFYVLYGDGTQYGPCKEAKVEYTEETTIADIPTNFTSIVVKGGELQLSQLKEDDNVLIYDTEGKKIYESILHPDTLSIPLSTYEGGIYILTINNVSYKIIVK